MTPISVEQRTADTHEVAVTLTDAPARIIDAILGHDGMRAELAIVMDLPPSNEHHREALRQLRESALLREAATVVLDPAAAERLAREVEEASYEPEPCRYPGCGRPRVDADYCGPHVLDGAA